MVRRRQWKLAYLLGSLLLLTASLHAPTAYSAPGDPPSGSPAGAVYELPLEQGRSDAAPKGGGGTEADPESATTGAGGGGGSEGQGESGSLYRSENNFGSSSRVPGAPAEGQTGGPAARDGGAAAGGGNGSGGGESGGGETGSGAAGSAPPQIAGAGNTSVPASVILLGAIALLAVGVGVLSRRLARGRTPGE